ncbi:hypothetical protein Hanom_Chr13g01241481 [Helianthus anomalus]
MLNIISLPTIITKYVNISINQNDTCSNNTKPKCKTKVPWSTKPAGELFCRRRLPGRSIESSIVELPVEFETGWLL